MSYSISQSRSVLSGVRLLGAALLVAVSTGCATQAVTFTANKKARVSLVTLDDLNGVGELLGEVPVTVEVDKLRDKVVKISGDGIVPFYWATTALEGTNVSTKIVLQDIPVKDAPAGQATQPQPPQQPDDEPKVSNITHRLLLRAYQALTRDDPQVATELADRLILLAPDLASPLIVKGIAHMQMGRRAEAARAFTTAKALDPEDTDIDELIKAVQ